LVKILDRPFERISAARARSRAATRTGLHYIAVKDGPPVLLGIVMTGIANDGA
jgi:hypothetical protein